MMTDKNKNSYKYKLANTERSSATSYPSSPKESGSHGSNSKFRANRFTFSPNQVPAESSLYEREAFVSMDDNMISDLIEKNLMKLWTMMENIKDANEEIFVESIQSKSVATETIKEKSKKINTSIKLLFHTLKESMDLNEQNKIKKSLFNAGIQVLPLLDDRPNTPPRPITAPRPITPPRPIAPPRPTVNQPQPTSSSPTPADILKSLPKELYAKLLDQKPQPHKRDFNSNLFKLLDNEMKKRNSPQKSLIPYEPQQTAVQRRRKEIQKQIKKTNYSTLITISRPQDDIPQIKLVSNVIDQPDKQPPESAKENQRVKRVNRSAAIIIIPLRKDLKDNAYFKNTCRMILSKVKDKLNSASKMRRTQTGHLLIELKKRTNAFKVAPKIQTILGDDFKVKPLVDRTLIEIRDLDPIVSKEKIKSDLIRILRTKEEESIVVLQLSSAWRGTQRAVVELAMGEFKKLQQHKYIKIGVVCTTWREIPRVIRCYKCHHFGHMANKCKMAIDAIECCRRCGDIDHDTRTCSKKPCCSICRDEGFGVDLNHVTGSIRCPAYKRIMKEAKQKQKLITPFSNKEIFL
mgnify:CR=1 FL=1